MHFYKNGNVRWDNMSRADIAIASRFPLTNRPKTCIIIMYAFAAAGGKTEKKASEKRNAKSRGKGTSWIDSY